jgi:salicylate hydroxylase
MSPHLGAGAGQAIEVNFSFVPLYDLEPLQDAYILASVLRDATANSLDAALEAYQQTRLPVANHVLKSSDESGKMFEFNSRYAEDYTALGPAIKHQWDFLTQSTPEGEAEKAVEIFRNMQEP